MLFQHLSGDKNEKKPTLLGRLHFILGYDVGVQEGNIRKTMAARGLVNGEGPTKWEGFSFPLLPS